MTAMTDDSIDDASAPLAASWPIIQSSATMPKLIAIEGPARGATYALEQAEISVGRSSSNVIAIADLSLSRHHSAIRCVEGVYTLCDLQSNNGTFVNGEPITEHRLAHGDRIAIGDS